MIKETERHDKREENEHPDDAHAGLYVHAFLRPFFIALDPPTPVCMIRRGFNQR